MECQNHGGHSSANGGRNAVRLTDLGPDDTDRLLLSIARYFLRAQAFPHSGDDRMAITVADISFGYGRGAAMAAAMSRAIEVLRMSRPVALRYHDPDCPICAGRLSEAEVLLVQVFRSVRRGQVSAASAHAMLLCEGNDSAPFLAALARVFDVLASARWDRGMASWLAD